MSAPPARTSRELALDRHARKMEQRARSRPLGSNEKAKATQAAAHCRLVLNVLNGLAGERTATELRARLDRDGAYGWRSMLRSFVEWQRELEQQTRAKVGA